MNIRQCRGNRASDNASFPTSCPLRKRFFLPWGCSCPRPTGAALAQPRREPVCDEDAERLRAERNAKQQRAYYLANREKALARAKAYRTANREKHYAAAYREANKEKRKASQKAYHAANREKRRAYMAAYRAARRAARKQPR